MTRELDFDEIVAICASAAEARGGYPADLANMVGEMTLWLERHGLPGVQALANWLDIAPSFDPEKAGPRQLESGGMEFPDPFIGGMFLVDMFDQITLPALVKAPESAALLMTPFLAMAAQQRDIPLTVAFLGSAANPNEAAQLTYRDGKSRFDGRIATALAASDIGIDKPAFMPREVEEPAVATIEVDASTVARLSATV